MKYFWKNKMKLTVKTLKGELIELEAELNNTVIIFYDVRFWIWKIKSKIRKDSMCNHKKSYSKEKPLQTLMNLISLELRRVISLSLWPPSKYPIYQIKETRTSKEIRSQIITQKRINKTISSQTREQTIN